MSEATATAKGRPVVYGIDDSVLEDLANLTLSVDDLSDGLLANIDVTLVGVETVRGGEERESKTTPGEYYVTQDQMIWHLRVDDAFDLGFESDAVAWYFNLPRAVERDGKRNRADPGRNSDYGVLLSDLESIGISANTANAAHYQFRTMADLIGLHFKREQKDAEDRKGSKRRQFRITGLYDFDNEVRKQVGLTDAYLAGQEPAVAAAKSK